MGSHRKLWLKEVDRIWGLYTVRIWEDLTQLNGPLGEEIGDRRVEYAVYLGHCLCWCWTPVIGINFSWSPGGHLWQLSSFGELCFWVVRERAEKKIRSGVFWLPSPPGALAPDLPSDRKDQSNPDLIVRSELRNTLFCCCTMHTFFFCPNLWEEK